MTKTRQQINVWFIIYLLANAIRFSMASYGALEMVRSLCWLVGQFTTWVQSEISTCTVWIGIAFDTDIVLAQCVLMTFHLVPPAGWHFLFEWKVLTSIGWIAKIFSTGINISHSRNCRNVVKPWFCVYQWLCSAQCVQYFGLWPDTCKTNDISISLSSALCLVS